MTTPRLVLSALVAFTCTLTGDFAFSHGSTVPLYVAEDGLDGGRCDEESAPCATIAYALSQAGKGTEIRVAAGTYQIDKAEDVFYLVSDIVNVVGGYQAPNSKLKAEQAVSVLTGVPHTYRELLADRGFRIVADRKAVDGPKAVEAERLLQIYETLQSSLPATPCVAGFAGALPCDAMDLLSFVSHLNVGAGQGSTNDVWGFVDLNTNREYVLAGFNGGVGVFDVTDPEVPVEVGFIPGQISSWRDVKVYQYFDDAAQRYKAYGYVTTEASDGLVVIDMTGLPHFVRRSSYSTDIISAHNVYISNTDASTGLSLTGDAPNLIIAGANSGRGRYRAYSLANASAPAFIEDAPSADYMHDAASMIISDSRISQCGGNTAYCEILLDFNEARIEIWDITDAASPTRLSSTPYTNASYVHSGWWSEDQQFMFVHDEADELDHNLPTTVRIFSLADLQNPQLVGTWSGATDAIDHNGFVRGNRYYMSNYSRGLTVLDITNPAIPAAVGRLDTYPISDSRSFVGAWGAYPFLPSGTIAISDIQSGLYLAEDLTRDVPEGQLAFSAPAFAAAEGIQSQLTVQRSGGSTGQVSVDYQLLHATSDSSDIEWFGATPFFSGTLTWSAGDAANKSILMTAVDDAVAEGLETVFVRLINPTGGATLGNNNVSGVYLSDPGATAVVSFSGAAVGVAENDNVPAVITLQRTESAVGAASVDYSMTAGDAQDGVNYQGNTTGTVSWADGDATPRTLEFTILDDSQNNPSTFVELTLSNAVGAAIVGNATVQLVIEDGAGSNQAPSANPGMSQTLDEGTAVTLDGSQSSDPDGNDIGFEWTQTGGQAVMLSNPTGAVTTFTAPAVGSDTLLQFQLTVFDTRGSSSTSGVTVTVINHDPNNGGGGGKKGRGAIAWLSLLGLVLLGLRRRRVSRTGSA